MCGIAGFLAPPGELASVAVLERMVATLRHRGPDAVGYKLDGRVALGVARLRIQDLETGDQPIGSEDGRVTVVLNGEIYDYQRQRAALLARGHRFRSQSDTEIIAHAWEDLGERCLADLNGMFAFAVWDGPRQHLFLARDRMGEKPLYYLARDGWLVFASELRALLAHPVVPRRLDLEGLSRYLAYDYVPDPHSILAGTSKLPPAHCLSATSNGVSVRRYWDIPFAPEPDVDERSWQREIAQHLDRAVELRLAGDVPIGCFVSGGIDSTTVAATASRYRPGIRTFSVGYAGSAHDERPYARLAADYYATRHEELVVSAADAGEVLGRLGRLLDEPLADMSFVPLYLLSRAARGTVTVALTGDGGDELFGGYPMMAAEWWQRGFARLPERARSIMRRASAGAIAETPFGQFLEATALSPEAGNQTLIGGLSPRRRAALLSPAVRRELAGFDPYRDIDDALASCPAPDATGRMLYRYCKLYLAGQNLVNADRASMASGLELRAPFLDHTFVELMGRIPSALKVGGFRRLKRLLKNSIGDRLPPPIRARRKQGFGVPLGAWLRGPLKSFLHDILTTERIRAAELFEPLEVERLVREHVSGAQDHGRVLWSTLVFELWRREYLSPRTLAPDLGSPAATCGRVQELAPRTGAGCAS
jgi:asparagine synthase (glutamine-hydrolysing)